MRQRHGHGFGLLRGLRRGLDCQVITISGHYAKSFWPYIDGLNTHTFVDETMLGHLTGKDVAKMTAREKSLFRVACRHAFEDMVRAGGLLSWREEIRGVGRRKTRRYHYRHALEQQMELDLIEGPAAV